MTLWYNPQLDTSSQPTATVSATDECSDEQKIAEAFHLGNVNRLAVEVAPDYNAAPQSMQPVIVWDSTIGMRTLHMMFWRFLPPYVTDPKEVPTRHDQCQGRNADEQFGVA